MTDANLALYSEYLQKINTLKKSYKEENKKVTDIIKEQEAVLKKLSDKTKELQEMISSDLFEHALEEYTKVVKDFEAFYVGCLHENKVLNDNIRDLLEQSLLSSDDLKELTFMHTALGRKINIKCESVARTR